MLVASGPVACVKWPRPHPEDRSSCPASSRSCAWPDRLQPARRFRRRVVPSGGRFGFLRGKPFRPPHLRAWRFHRFFSHPEQPASALRLLPIALPEKRLPPCRSTAFAYLRPTRDEKDLTSASFALHLRFARHISEESARCVFRCCNGARCRIRRLNFSVPFPVVKPES